MQRQALAGLMWSKQFYHYSVELWLEGDPAQPPPPEVRKHGRNADWTHLYNLDVLSMPDKWEYPWYAAWDLAFHTLPIALIDPEWAKRQLILLLREWYMHPNGQLPAYEWAFGDVNPPVHAWAAWQVYKITRAQAGTTPPSWSGSFTSCCSTLPGGSTARMPTATTSFRAASWGWTTSASLTAARPCPPAATSSRPTAPPGWPCTA